MTGRGGHTSRGVAIQWELVGGVARRIGVVHVVSALVATCVLGPAAVAEIRPFAVMLAHSPKSFADTGGFPEGGLASVEQIRRAYFDGLSPDVDSFAEYWEEISYGDVRITGRTFDWVNLPWAFGPTNPNAPPRPSPADYIDLNEGLFVYGSGENFCDAFASADVDTAITAQSCGALIITDLVGDRDGALPPTRGAGLDDVPAAGVAVWSPGERFLDVDGDNRWDGLDEKNDMMCHGVNGCSANLCSVSRTACLADPDCPAGETCILGGDPAGTGPMGCSTPGCGDLAIPCIDWDGDGDCRNIFSCVIPSTDHAHPSTAVRECVSDGECDLPPGYEGPACISGYCVPDNCAAARKGGVPQLTPCCTGDEDTDPPDCIEFGLPGITCALAGSPIIVCCEFDDYNVDDALDAVEPFEDYMVRWQPGTSGFDVWVPVTSQYVRDNYPGDAETLIRTTGNGYYNSPDVFRDRGSTKMIQLGINGDVATPKPGARYPSTAPNFEAAWFDGWWQGRYGTPPPPWPGGDGAEPAPNSPLVRAFDAAEPTPRELPDATARRWFKSNRGGWNGFGRGTIGSNEDRIEPYDLGTLDPPMAILPEEVFGYYDGWVEHDDLASSIYHRAGDKRFGEITSPFADTVMGISETGVTYGELPAISGQDRGPNDPGQIGIPDGFGVAAGPRAVNIHGDKGFDAGDLAIIEFLTWRTDGVNRTFASAWEEENGPYHPYAGPTAPRTGGPIGFADYNLDGMIDQGEVRPAFSENYRVDSAVQSVNDGVRSNYPFNRKRLAEDVVEALDNGVDWDDFVGPDHFLPPDPTRRGAVSGVILIPEDSFFAGTPSEPSVGEIPPVAPDFSVIENRDTGTQAVFHDLVMELGGTPVFLPEHGVFERVPTAAHAYLHAWEHYPDMYDYDVLRAETALDENCPMGVFDVMANGGLVHPIAPLKEELSGWIESVDLRTVLTPGVETTLILPPAEVVRDESYYFLENEENPGERYYFWAAGLGFDERFPGAGLFILGTRDIGVLSNPEAAAQQQRTRPFNFRVIEADAAGDLEACSSTGNRGDDGDLWPGSSGATHFGFNTDPPAVWQTDNRWTGLDITNIEPDGNGAVRLTLSLTPTNIPSLRFIVPPGGESVAGVYQVRFEATDVFGGTNIQLYYTDDQNDLTIQLDGSNRIGQRIKGTPGTIRTSMNWSVANLADGRYHIFAKLIPGVGADGVERAWTDPRPSRNSLGSGTLDVLDVDISSAVDATARSESWSITCIDAAGSEWVVYSSLTQPEPEDRIPGPFAHAFTCPQDVTNCANYPYRSLGGEVTFVIREGTTPFGEGDSFYFTTTGITAPSAAVQIVDGSIKLSPRAVIKASPLVVRPGEAVFFDASNSTDPQRVPLSFSWDFGDGFTGAGEQVSHFYSQPGSFTVTLTAINTDGRFGEATIEIIVFNSSPHAVFTASPRSGPAPLLVELSAVGSSDTETPAEDLIYQWDLGDGTTLNDQGDVGTRWFQTIEHTFERAADGTACTLAAPCKFVVQLTVTDYGGKSDTTTRTILVGNRHPVPVVTVFPRTGVAPADVVFNAINSFDPDGDVVTVDWSFGDGGVKLNVPLTGDPGETNGTVRHTYVASGTYHPTATVRDGRDGEAVWSGVSITVLPSDTAGACCVVDLVCFNDVTPSDCGLLDGEYLGAALRCDEDPDGDGVTGCGDACPYDPDKTEGGLCGCGIADDDTDGDGVLDCFDQCPDTDPGAVIDEFGCEHRGACCFAVGVCVDDVPSVDCAFVGGVFQGRNTTCAADCRFPGNGDVDGNGVIDLLDAAYWVSCMTGPGVSLVDDVCRPLDMDGEGAIDLRDAAVFANRFLD